MQKTLTHITAIKFHSTSDCLIFCILLFFSHLAGGQSPSEKIYTEWGKSWGDSQKQEAEIVKSDSYGNIYIAGSFDSDFKYSISGIEYTLKCAGGTDIFFAKLNLNGELVYLKSIGGTDNDILGDMHVDAIGTVFLCGNFRGSINLLNPNAPKYISKGDIDFFIAKFGPKGEWKYARTFGDSLTDECKNIKIDHIGNIYLSGFFTRKISFKSVATTDLTLQSENPNTKEAFYLKLNSQGDCIWAKKLSLTTTNPSLSMDTDLLGNIYLAGTYQGTLNLNAAIDPKSFDSFGGSRDIFFAKLDGNGSCIFTKTIGNIGNENIYQLTVNNSGDIILIGSFQKELDFDHSASTNILRNHSQSSFLVAYNNQGDFKFVQGISTNSDAILNVVTDTKNNIYITGSFFSDASFSETNEIDTLISSAGDFDAFIAKYLSNGNLETVKRMGGLDAENAYSICKGIEGRIYIVGGFNGIANFDTRDSYFDLASIGNKDIFLIGLLESDINFNVSDFTLSGIVHADDKYLPQGIIFLYEFVNNNYLFIQDVPINQGAFIFKNLSEGTYKLLATADGIETDLYKPTYYVNKLNLRSSDSILVRGNTYGIDLRMQKISQSNVRVESLKAELYPNPLVGDFLNIEIISDCSGEGSVTIYNLDGNIVLQENIQVKEGAQTVRISPKVEEHKLFLVKIHYCNRNDEILLSTH